MSFLQDFKRFVIRGNVVDLATGVIIGAAFGKIVASLVDNILMPPIGFALSGINFSELAVTLRGASEGRPAVVIGYGKFLQSSVDFLIVAFCIFIFIQVIHKIQRKEASAPVKAPELTTSEKLLLEIRDLLKNPPTPVKDDSSVQ
ncbi:MAG: large-conductance mechanosensitive channel protein MscL [Chitinophagaceae bacterium]|nr:large-conductance mechanosensitive channel protein MscL [Oligoflexus sp.]